MTALLTLACLLLVLAAASDIPLRSGLITVHFVNDTRTLVLSNLLTNDRKQLIDVIRVSIP